MLTIYAHSQVLPEVLKHIPGNSKLHLLVFFSNVFFHFISLAAAVLRSVVYLFIYLFKIITSHLLSVFYHKLQNLCFGF